MSGVLSQEPSRKIDSKYFHMQYTVSAFHFIGQSRHLDFRNHRDRMLSLGSTCFLQPLNEQLSRIERSIHFLYVILGVHIIPNSDRTLDEVFGPTFNESNAATCDSTG